MTSAQSETQSVWRVHPNVRFRRLFDEAIALHQEQAEALVINDTGAAFLELCDGQRSWDEIVTLLCEQFEVDAKTLQEDLMPFAHDLQNIGFIVAAESENSEDVPE